MKIVHIITRLVLGGAQENTLITCKLLADRGHDVTLITGPAIGPEGQLLEQTKNQKYKVILIPKMIRAICLLYDTISYYQIKKLLKLIKPDIVHTHSAKAGILGRFAAYSLRKTHFANRATSPVRNSTMGTGDTIQKGKISNGASDERRATKIVHTIHGLAFHPYQDQLINNFYIAIEKSAAKRTDFFISVADAMTSQALAAGIGRPEQFITAYSAIDEDDFLDPIPDQHKKEFRLRYEIPEDAIVLITIARLFMLKGHKYIIESAKKLSKRFGNAIWLFVGDGILANHFKRQVHKLGLVEKVKFTGLLPPGQIPLAIASSDILIHCSLREGLARALPQAMLCAKPVISFDIDGAKEVVNENTGRLIEPKNIEQLTQACAELIENAQLRQKLGQTGRESVKEKFSPKTMVDTIEAVYQKLLEKNKQPTTLSF